MLNVRKKVRSNTQITVSVFSIPDLLYYALPYQIIELEKTVTIEQSPCSVPALSR
jgi:hypothetical protein